MKINKSKKELYNFPKPFIDIKNISSYRAGLMGFAILWIMMLHFTFTQIKPLGFIAQYGFAGVEIFIMVSGFGLFFSLDKDNNLLLFYRKRLLRIFPTYYILGIFASTLLFHDNILEYLFRYTTIGFWIRGIYWEWYIPSILLLYLLAPLIKYLFDKNHRIVLCLISITPLIVAYALIDKDNILDRAHFFLLYRIPAFIFGMACAYWLKNGESIRYYIITLLIGIPLFVYFFPKHHDLYNFKYFSLLFLLPSFIVIIIYISRCIRFISPIMNAMGKASLETYLVQGMFFHAILYNQIIISPTWHDLISLFLIILSTGIGISVHWLIGRSGISRIV